MGRTKKASEWFKMPDNDKKKPNSASTVLRQTLGTFSQQTSISGVSNAGIANSYFRKGCWLLIFTVFVIFTLHGFQDVVNDYIEYPVTTSIYVEHRSQVSNKKSKDNIEKNSIIDKKLST